MQAVTAEQLAEPAAGRLSRPHATRAVNAAFPRTNLLRHPRFIHTCLFRQIQLFVVMNDR